MLTLHLISLDFFAFIFHLFAAVMQKEFRVRHVGMCRYGFYWTATKTRMDNNRSIRGGIAGQHQGQKFNE